MKIVINIRMMLSLVLILTPGVLVAETHQKVQAALDYELRENSCQKPKKLASTKSVSNAPPQVAGSTDYFSGAGTTEFSDVDSYTLKRLKKKEQRWKKCVDEYKDSLLADMNRLKNSAQFGLTQEQANIIAAKMLAIQNVYMTPDGVLESNVEDSN